MHENQKQDRVKGSSKAQSRSQTGAPSSPRPKRSTPPYNPGLQKLVDGKQAWAVPLEPEAKARGFLGWHQRGYVPHYDAPWITQFITLRLVDSLPASRRAEWEQLLRIENARVASPKGTPTRSQLIGSNSAQSRSHTGAPGAPTFRRLNANEEQPASNLQTSTAPDLIIQSQSQTGAPSQGAPTFRRLNANEEQPTSNLQTNTAHDSIIQSRSQTGAPFATEAGRERRRRLESYLDRGMGECWLRQPAIAELTEGALRFFDGKRYRLAAWVVMPNHLHVLVEIWDVPMGEAIKSWKDFVCKKANKLLKRQGAFWEREYLDTAIEDEQHRQTAIRYIENNPTKARLVLNPKQWSWSSARFRDEYGVLKLSRSADVSSA